MLKEMLTNGATVLRQVENVKRNYKTLRQVIGKS